MLIVLYVPMAKDKQLGITEADIARYKELYPNINIIQSLRNMIGWLDSHEKKKSRTDNGVKKRINFWLSKDQEKYLERYEKHSRTNECATERAARLSREADERERVAQLTKTYQANNASPMGADDKSIRPLLEIDIW